jgi:hypothetical protein
MVKYFLKNRFKQSSEKITADAQHVVLHGVVSNAKTFRIILEHNGFLLAAK